MKIHIVKIFGKWQRYAAKCSFLEKPSAKAGNCGKNKLFLRTFLFFKEGFSVFNSYVPINLITLVNVAKVYQEKFNHPCFHPAVGSHLYVTLIDIPWF